MSAAKTYTGYSVRRPLGKSGPADDARAEIVSRHRTARAALVSLRQHPRDAQGYSNCFIFCEKTQLRISNYEADMS